MKVKKNTGYAVIEFNTDLERSMPFDESKLTAKQRSVLSQLSACEQERIRLGYLVSIVDLENEQTICEFNKEGHVIPNHDIESIARALLPSIQEFYSKEENIKAFEEWKKQNNK